MTKEEIIDGVNSLNLEKTGKWYKRHIYRPSETEEIIECSNCGALYPCIDYNSFCSGNFQYCPHCGSKNGDEKYIK